MEGRAKEVRRECKLPDSVDEGCSATKAETLQWLKPRLRKSRILDMYVFSVKQWSQDAAAVLEAIGQHFPAQRIVIRSSSRFEDCSGFSNAGVYHSILGVQSSHEHEVCRAVEKVLSGFDGDFSDQVLVQPQLMPVSIAGVVSSRTIPDGQPYYVFSYESGGGTSGVTAGKDLTHTWYLRRNDLDAVENELPAVLRPVHAAVQEIEALMGDIPVQLEFGCRVPGDVVVFQVRPLPGSTWGRQGASALVWTRVTQDLQQAMGEAAGLPGVRTLLGIMPDWNPAELLGVHPSPLALSLYRALISSGIWCRARSQLGYKDIGTQDFLHVLAGKPYVNVRTSFSSLLPAGLSRVTHRNLLEGWLDRLDANPQFHDSVEFNVAQTCVDFCFEQDYKDRYGSILDNAAFGEFAATLRWLTLKMIRRSVAADISMQKQYWQSASSSTKGKQGSAVLHDTLIYGSLPFARVARQAFVAEAMLRSAALRGALSKERLRLFRQSIASVGSRFLHDWKKLQDGAMGEVEFMQIYGHLRPNSFDICSPCYRDRPWRKDGIVSLFSSGQNSFAFTEAEKRSLRQLLTESGLEELDVEEWIDFVREAIAGRERSKFLFSGLLSGLLEQLVRIGASTGLDRDACSLLEFREMETLANISRGGGELAELQDRIDDRRAQRQLEKEILLPPLVRSLSDLHCFELAQNTPHFIGSARVQGQPLLLDNGTFSAGMLKGKIACIEFADPGFDWIFTEGISGLITAFGGPNSHMAVRCAELKVPAAIGSGQVLFQRLSTERWLMLDCENNRLRSPDHADNGLLSMVDNS
jgi:hypothetical protein